MSQEQTKAEVREAVVGIFNAWRAADVEGLKKFSQPEMYGYYYGAGLVGEGIGEHFYDDMRVAWKEGFKSTTAPTHIVVRPVGSEAAIATFYIQGSETYQDGRTIEGTWRATVVLNKVNSQWKWLHYHYSPLTTTQTERFAQTAH
jgi:ketosteroid isomerase-like protein